MQVEGRGVMVAPAVAFAGGGRRVPRPSLPLPLGEQASSLPTGKVPQLLPVLPVQLRWRQATHNKEQVTQNAGFWGEQEGNDILEATERGEGKVSVTNETRNTQNQIRCKESCDNKRSGMCVCVCVCVKDTHQAEYPGRQK